MAKKTNPTLFGRFQRFRGKGQHDAAIEEVQTALEKDPENMRLMHRLGDLCAKAEYIPEAIEAYLRVAESYTEDAHFQKALAVYKQILRLDEKRVDVQLLLAEVFVSLDRRGDALSQYQNIAFLFEQQGDLPQAVSVYQSMLSLDPHNIPLHVKLAELFLAQQDTQQATQEFEKALHELASQERWGDYLKVGERLLFIDPNNMEVLRRLSSIYLQQNEVMKAVAKLQIAYKHNRRDTETLELLIEAFTVLRQPPKALSVLQQLAEVYQNNQDILQARKTYERILALNPNDANARQAYEELKRAPTPTQETAAHSPARTSASLSSSSPGTPPVAKNQEHLEKLLAEAEVFQKYGLANRVLEKLQQLLTINARYGPARKMRAEILLAREDFAQAAEDLWVAAQNLPPVDALPCLERILEISEAPPQIQESAYQVLVRLRQQHPELLAEEIPQQVLEESFGDIPAISRHQEPEGAIEGAAEDDDAISVEDDIAIEPDDDDAISVEDEDAISVEDEDAISVEDDIAIEPDDDDAIEPDDDEAISVEEDASDQTGQGLSAPTANFAPPKPPAFAPPPPPPPVPTFAPLPPPPAPTFAPPPPPPAPTFAPPPPKPMGFAPPPPSPPAPKSVGFTPPAPASPHFAARPAPSFAPPPPTAPPPKPAVSPKPTTSGGSSLDDLEAQAARLEAMIKAKEGDETPAPAPSAPAPRPEIPHAPWLDASPTPQKIEAPLPPPPFGKAAEAPLPPPPFGKAAEAPLPPPPFGKPTPTAPLPPTPFAAPTPPKPIAPSWSPPAATSSLAAEPIEKDDEDLSTLDQPDEAKTPRPAQEEEFEELDDALILEEQLSLVAEKLEEAALYLGQEEYAYALELYDFILSEDPQNREALRGRDHALSALRDQEQELEKHLEHGANDILLDLDSALGFAENAPAQRARDRVAEEIKQFQQAVQQSVNEDEGETHFELGIAFHSMGLYSQAVEEFQTCLRGGFRQADCYKMIGNSYAAQGKSRQSVEIYTKALELPSLDPHDRLDLLYEVAQAHEQDGNPQGALQYFEEVYMIDQSYRGVAARVQQLRSRLGI